MQRVIRREQVDMGLRLQAIRHARDITQEHAAAAIGISVMHLRRIELAHTNVTLGMLVACSLAYKIELAELFKHPG